MSIVEQKLSSLTAAGQFDICAPGECIQVLSTAAHITYNRRAGGCGRMLKVLLNGYCSYDCAYCSIRVNRERLGFSPDEFAEAFLRLWHEDLVGGLFLSSGIPHDVDLVMHDLVETGEILRCRGYDGYLHLKILPGAARADIHDAARVADRISINLETTSSDRLGCIAGVKDYQQDILKRQAWVAEEKPEGHTTQPLAEHPDTPAWRARRCYQADYLLRDYGFTADELKASLDEDGFFENRDPKKVIAADMMPVNVNTATKWDLLRVPGIGPKAADRIIRLRKQRPFTGPADLARAGIRGQVAARHLTFGNRKETIQTKLVM